METSWLPPLKKHMRAGGLEFVTIKVRVFSAESELDVMCKFDSIPLYPKDVCKYLADKQHIPPSHRDEFALWIIGRDIELQLRSNQCIFHIMKNWHRWTEKYTNYPECKNPAHPINRHWFVYRRRALSDNFMSCDKFPDSVLMLMFGEANHYIQSSKYVCTAEDIVRLAGLQLQATVGNFDPLRQGDHYLKQSDRWNYLVPEAMRKSLKPSLWVQRIMESYMSNKGKSARVSRVEYIEYIRQWKFYANAFFPCCEILPPGGYFEMRTQHLLFGVGIEGVTIIDTDKLKIIFSEAWPTLLWEFGADNLKIWYKDGTNGKRKNVNIKTPQAAIIENVVKRAVHLLQKRGEEFTPVDIDIGKKKAIAGILERGIQTGASKRFEDIRTKRGKTASMLKVGDNLVEGIGIVVED